MWVYLLSIRNIMSNNHLVVGVNGIIGSALFTHLQSMGVSAWGTTHRTMENKPSSVFYLNLLEDPTSWQLPPIIFDVVYLCAAVCKIFLCEENPTGTSQVNVMGMSALARYLSDRGALIIYLSTNQVFSGKEPFVLAMADYAPMTEYGRQKVQMESFIKNHCPRWAVVRLTKVMWKNMPLWKNWIDRLLSHQAIEAFHDMVLAPVALKWVIDILTVIGQKQKTGYYQVSGRQDVSYYDLANHLVNYLERPSSLVQPVRATEKGVENIFLPPFTTLDCTETVALCDIKPSHFLDVLNVCIP